MRTSRYAIIAIAGAGMLSACSDDGWKTGNPQMDVKTSLGAACFGDSLRFTINASDAEVPLSTLRTQLFFGDEMVSEKVIRTKNNGSDYTGAVYVPYLANIPDGRATLRVILQNINFTKTELEYEVMITHPEYPSLTFVAEDGMEYIMLPQEKYVYSFRERLPQELKGYIKAPKYGENGNELTFGYESSMIKVGAESPIPFSNSNPGKYTVSFNTFTFEGAPFTKLMFDNNLFESVDDTHAEVNMNLSQGQSISPAGFPNFSDWWIDPDYFTREADGTLTFLPQSGSYKVIADLGMQYFRVYPLNGSNPATLNEDGTGAVWAIGAGVGKPSVGSNEVGWTTENALALAPVGDRKYQLTLVAGQTVKSDAINFKFFHQMGWGGEFGGDALTSTSDIVKVGTGEDGHDNGNLYLADGKQLEPNHVYIFTVDLSGGAKAGVLSVTDAGEQAFEEKPVSVSGIKLTTSDNSFYEGVATLSQGAPLGITGLTGLDEYYADPDYFTYDEDNNDFIVNVVDSDYRIRINKAAKTISAVMMNGGEEATFDNGGAIWLMGWGVGSPSMDSQFGWTPGAAYCMAQISPKVYRFTGIAGPEHGSTTGMRVRTDYLSFKFFMQDGWGGEFSGANALRLTGSAPDLIKDAGNFELADGVTLEEGATYVITVDLTAGPDAGTIDMVKK